MKYQTGEKAVVAAAKVTRKDIIVGDQIDAQPLASFGHHDAFLRRLALIGQGPEFRPHAECFSDGNLRLVDMVAPGSRRNRCRERSPFDPCSSYVLQDGPGKFELIIGRYQGLTNFGQADLHRQHVRFDGGLIAKTRLDDLQMLLDLFDGFTANLHQVPRLQQAIIRLGDTKH